jgi:hypothetical protein
MVVGFTTIYASSAYDQYKRYEFEPSSWWGVLDRTFYDQVCQWLAEGRWFSSDIPLSSSNKTDHHDIAEILLKVTLSSITQPF